MTVLKKALEIGDEWELVTVKVRSWGSSLGAVIPHYVVDKLGVKVGDELHVVVLKD